MRLRLFAALGAVIATSILTVALGASPAGAAPFTYSSVSTGYHRTCAVTSDGLGLCWGWNYAGSLATGDRSSTVLSPSIVSLPAGERFSHIEAGSYFTSCGLTTVGNVYCWGEGAAPSRFALPAGAVVNQLSVGATQVCALTTDARLFCHGDFNSGELGVGTAEYSHLPQRVVLPDNAVPTQVSAGVSFTCVVTTIGTAYCSGINAAGQLGNGSTNASKTFVRVATAPGVILTAISAGLERACARDTRGGGWCWGENYAGSFGDDTYLDSATPRPVALDPGISLVDLQTGWYHTCALTTTGSALCWGSNDQGALGWGQSYGGKTIRTAALPAGVVAEQLDVGLAGTCVTSGDSRVFCWGSNLRGSVGNGSTAAAFSPTQILAVGPPDASSPVASNVGTHSTTINASFVPHGATTSAVLFIAPLDEPTNVRSVSINIPRSRQSSLAQLFAPITFDSTVGGLRPATTYSATVRVANAYGSSDSPAVTFTTLGDSPSVGTTTVSDIGGDGAGVRTVVDPNLLDTSVSLSYSTDATFATNVTTTSLGVTRGSGETELSASLDSLAPRTTYWVRITASNEVGTSTGTAVSFTTIGAEPSNVSITATGGRRRAAIDVTVDTGQLRTTVRVSYRATGSRDTWQTRSAFVSSSSTSASFDLTGLLPATTYDVQVEASNAVGVAGHPEVAFSTSGGAPDVSRTESADVADSTATVRTRIDSNEFTTRVTLQIDTEESFSNYDEWFAGSLTAGSESDISLDVSDLVDSTVYFARFVATNPKGTTVGATISFTTTTPVGKLLKRRVDPVDPTPVVQPTPMLDDDPLVIVAPLTQQSSRVATASSRTAKLASKKTAKAKPAKRAAVKKRSVPR